MMQVINNIKEGLIMDTSKELLQIPEIRITAEMLEKRFEHPELKAKLEEILSSGEIKARRHMLEQNIEIITECFQISDLGYTEEIVIRMNLMSTCLYRALEALATGEGDDLIAEMLKALTIETTEEMLSDIMLRIGYVIGKYTSLVDSLGKDTTDQILEIFGLEAAIELADQMEAAELQMDFFDLGENDVARQDN